MGFFKKLLKGADSVLGLVDRGMDVVDRGIGVHGRFRGNRYKWGNGQAPRRLGGAARPYRDSIPPVYDGD